MADPSSAYDFQDYLRRRWRFIAIACAVAVSLAAAVSLALPKKYTATARIVIEPPPGDQRVAVALSPIYLESLKTYERFASSDSLFLRALVNFGLRSPGDTSPVEAWKRRVLKIEIPRNTRILEISATLPDPKKAQAMARFIADGTIALSRAVSHNAVQETMKDVEKQLAEARTRVERADAAWDRAARQPTGQMSDDIASLAELKADLMYDLSEAESEPSEPRPVGSGQDNAPARTAALKKQIADVEREMSRKQDLMAERSARAETLLSERRQAEGALAAAENRLRDLRYSEAFRGEQLSIIDPGITPERPSSPNLPLNVIAAFLVALAGSVAYLTLQFGLSRQTAAAPRAPLRVASHNG